MLKDSTYVGQDIFKQKYAYQLRNLLSTEYLLYMKFLKGYSISLETRHMCLYICLSFWYVITYYR